MKNFNSIGEDCVRTEGIPSVENETFDEVLDKVMSLLNKS